MTTTPPNLAQTSRKLRGPGAPLMPFDEWQIAQIRNALGAYRMYSTGRTGRRLTWLEVAGDIGAYVDVEIGEEVLRQFVEGVTKKSDPSRRRLPNPENLEAIKKFLLDPDIRALTDDDLKSPDSDFRAPRYLLDYLKQETDADIVRPPKKIEGQYQSVRASAGVVTDCILSIQIVESGDLIAVRESAATYKADNEAELLLLNNGQKSKRLKARSDSHGWCVVTPEDNLLFFMKERSYGRNHYYMTLISDLELYTPDPIEHFTLLRHTYPLDIKIDHPQLFVRNLPTQAVHYPDGAEVVIRNHVDQQTLFFDRVRGDGPRRILTR